MRPFRILSIDGGGIRGMIPARVLARLEDLTGHPTAQLFDLMAGTSTGGILALALARPQPMSAAALAALYRQHGPDVFAIPFGRRIGTVGGLLGPTYPADGLERLLERFLGATPLCAAGTRVLVPAYDIARHRPILFKSWHRDARHLEMRTVARATSAAPTYFPPARLETSDGTAQDQHALLIDGGIFANNPALCALAEARRLAPGREVLLVSLGTGESLPRRPTVPDAHSWGKVGWVRPLLDAMFDGMSDSVTYQAQQFLGQNYIRLHPQPLDAAQTMDNATPTALQQLEALADALIHREAAQLNRLAIQLAPQRAYGPESGDAPRQSPDSAIRVSDSETVSRPVP